MPDNTIPSFGKSVSCLQEKSEDQFFAFLLLKVEIKSHN